MTTPYHAYTKEANEEIIKTTTAETTSTSTSTSTAQIGLLEPDVVLTGTNSIIRTDGRLFAGDKQEKKEANPAVQVRRDWAYEDIPEDKKTTEAAESKQKFRLEIRNGTVQKTPILWANLNERTSA